MKNRYFSIKHQVQRAFIICFAFLSGAMALAQNQPSGGVPAARDKQKSAAPKYEMKEVQGQVLDAATKQPLAGVRVQALNNRSYTTMTDETGNYKIKVPKFVNSLYVSLAEYNSVQLAIKGDDNQNVLLYKGLYKDFYKDATPLINASSVELDETSSLTVENDIENHLNGAVRTINRGGVPAQGAAMFINGINSLNTNSQPLIVVDGVVWDMQYDRKSIFQGFQNNVFNMIDTEDIASVEVIPNGTAIYGAKGANGVIRINTKRGKSAVTKINIRVYGGFETTPTLTKMMDGNQFRNYVTEFLGTTTYKESLSKKMDVPFLNEDQNYLYYNMFHQNVDWQKDLYQTAFTQNYKLNVEGGDEVAMYSLSLGYTQSDATAKKTDFNRLNIRFNTDINMFRNFTTGLDIAYSRGAYNLRDNGWAADYASSNISSPNVLGLLQSPFVSPYYHFIRFDQDTKTLVPDQSSSVLAGKNYDDSSNPLAFASRFGYEGLANPYWILKNGQGDNKNFQEQTQFSININPHYQFTRTFSLSDRFSYILNRSNEKYYLPSNGTPTKEVEGLGGVQSVIKTQFSKETTIYNDLRGEWKKQMAAHFLDLNLGFRYSAYNFTNSYIRGYNNDNDKMPNMAYKLQYKDYGGSEDTWTNIAWYFDANYNYRNLYFVNLTTTMESSSRFGDEADGGLELAGVRWGLFPSVQLGWLMSSEDWFRVKGIDYLKLTAGFDITGNDNVDYYASRTYFKNFKFLDKATGLLLSNIENPKIKWETTKRFNVGFQTSLLHNRLMVGFNYFWSKTTELLVRKSVSDIAGLPYMWSNEGALKNSGFNLNVNSILVNIKNFKWEAGFSVGHYHNELTELPKSSLNLISTYALNADGTRNEATRKDMVGYTNSIYGQNNVLTAVGKPVGVFYGYATKGVFASEAEAATASNGTDYLLYPTGLTEQPSRKYHAGDMHFVDQNGDGWINEADMVVIGNPNPDIYGNLYTSFTWKNLKLDVNFKYSLGNDVYNFQRAQLESANNVWNQTTAVVNRWRYDGQQTDVPRTMCSTNDEWVNNERFSDRWIEDGSYLKMKKVRLTYTLPLNLSWLQGVAVWAEANNVFTVTKYLGTDPECTAGNGIYYQGIDTGLLPSNRNFNFGLTINL